MSGLGNDMHNWIQDLYYIPRSLTGKGVRETLTYLGALLPGLTTHSVPSGYSAFDWQVPPEWEVSDAFVADMSGRRVIDWKRNPLHLVGYSVPVNAKLSREELVRHLHTDPTQPSAIPYVTSYYEPNWGFCLTHNDLQELGDGPFIVKIDSRLFDGKLDYADLVIPGEREQEILFSSYVCHPSMANNELSGPVVLTALARWILAKRSRRYTYRFFLGPETIGPLVYLSKNLTHLRNSVIAGWVLTCLGDERQFSYLESRWGTTLADRVTRAVMRDATPGYLTYSFLERGSDERQWNAPGADLPVCSVMRSKYGTYPEYHTSLDNLELVTPRGLEQSLNLVRDLVVALERNCMPLATKTGEPQLGRRGLQSNVSKVGSATSSLNYRNVLAYSDGSNDLISMCGTVGLPLNELYDVVDVLSKHDLLICNEIPHP